MKADYNANIFNAKIDKEGKQKVARVTCALRGWGLKLSVETKSLEFILRVYYLLMDNRNVFFTLLPKD